MSVCIRSDRDFSAELSFVRELEKMLNVEFSQVQITNMIDLLVECEARIGESVSGSTGDWCFLCNLEKVLVSSLSKKQCRLVTGLWDQFVELRFLSSGVRTTKDSKALSGGGC
jgi:hypothetical protein